MAVFHVVSCEMYGLCFLHPIIMNETLKIVIIIKCHYTCSVKAGLSGVTEITDPSQSPIGENE
jgi:hypothetical protein